VQSWDWQPRGKVVVKKDLFGRYVLVDNWWLAALLAVKVLNSCKYATRSRS
jgi:hypothetical protein